MKKLGIILLAIVAVVVGLLVGTLNSDPAHLDLLWVQLELPLGLTILLGFSLGLITGLMVIYLARVLPLRLQLRKIQVALIKQEAPGEQPTSNNSLQDD